MEDNKVNISFFLDASRPNSDGKCLIKLNIYSKPDKKRYGTGHNVTKEEWKKLNSSNLKNEDLKAIKLKLNAIEEKASNVIKDLNPFSFVAFEERFFNKATKSQTKNLKSWFENYIKELKENGQIGTAHLYRTTKNSIDEFKKGLNLQDITPALLKSYESHLTSSKKSVSTISIYMRQIRTILNQAITAGVLPADMYPFRKYEIPSGRNVKKALKESDLLKLLNHKPEKKDEEKALDFWILSYLCNGMNFADIMELKPEDINGNLLQFVRQKTKRTKKKDLRPIKVGLNPRAIEIIEKYKNTNPENPYLFPFLEPNLSPLTIKHRSKRLIRWVNMRMENIRLDLEIDQKVGTYVARHSFSTVLKRKGISSEFIKESLGHSSLVTTENYLDSFTDDVKLEYSNLLTDL
jgi:integrase/recombinase XerD